MANLGSMKNPYTWSEYNQKVSMNTWSGGWVQSSCELTYRSHSLYLYTGCCARSHPVPYALYSEMQQNQLWLGGWATDNQDVLVYYSENGTQYDNTLGEISNPCPMSIYDEMVSIGLWEGGWIIESNGTIRYVQSLQIILNSGTGSGSGSSGTHGSGSGSGSGSGYIPGSGSGSGSGELEALGCSITAGNLHIADIRLPETGQLVGEIYLSWTEGLTIGQIGLSVVTFSIVPKSSATFNSNGIYTIWINAYETAIRGSFLYTDNGSSTVFHIDINFVIPEEYRQYV